MRISSRTTAFGLALLCGNGSFNNNNNKKNLFGRRGGGGSGGIMVVKAVDGDDDTNTTMVPTMAPKPNDCDNINIGSIYFFFLNSVDPDEVGLFPFEDIPGGLDLYLTDNAWTGTEFQRDEGTLQVRKKILYCL